MTACQGIPAPVLLRIPPFHARVPALGFCEASWSEVVSSSSSQAVTTVPPVLAEIRRLRVGGDYTNVFRPEPASGRRILLSLPRDLRAAAAAWHAAIAAHDVGRLRVVTPGSGAKCLPGLFRHIEAAGACIVSGPCNPHALLDESDAVLVGRMDDFGILGLAAGLPVRSMTAEGGIAEDPSAAEALVTRWTAYRDPFLGHPLSVGEAIARLVEWRRTIEDNRRVAVCVGMAWWKRSRMEAFFTHAPGRPVFSRRAGQAADTAWRKQGGIACWSTREPERLSAAAGAAGVPVWRVEDGFIRSLGLGSDLLPPSSVVVDRRGIYFDPLAPSDLEVLLGSYPFDEALRTRARSLTGRIIREGISKYGGVSQKAAMQSAGLAGSSGRSVILVPGQVADDQSVRRGGAGISGNLELLERVREAKPDAWIIYRPHPDVDAGHRAGAIDDDAVLRLASSISRGGPMTALLDEVDEVHTLTSLTGFEALMRGVRVSVWGQPFYAGWGLTTDYAPPLARRGRKLLLEELVAGTLILYPRYLDPVTELPCGPETLIERFSQTDLRSPSLRTVLRRKQGALRRRMMQFRMNCRRMLFHD